MVVLVGLLAMACAAAESMPHGRGLTQVGALDQSFADSAGGLYARSVGRQALIMPVLQMATDMLPPFCITGRSTVISHLLTVSAPLQE